MSTEKEFPKGIFIKRPHSAAPDFVLGSISIKNEDAIAFLQERLDSGKDWTNLDAKNSKDDKFYLEVNTYEKPSE